MPQTKVKVWLLSHTPQPEKTVASAARVCYSAVGGEQLMEKITDEKAQEFVQMLAEIGHESPI
jgi:thymidylate synthase (FAD)